MNLRKKMMIFIVIGIILIVVGLVIYFNSSDNNSYDDGKTDHRDEFTIVESNYLERNYKRYVAYGKKHHDYSDDKIITYVNIGLDNDFYTNVEKSNEQDGLIMIVNKYFYLSEDYKPETTTVGSFKAELSNKIVKDFNDMVLEGEKYQVRLIPVKSYISYEEQQTKYNISVTVDGEKETLKNIAKPGYSDYQTGLAVDISGETINFAKTKEYAWLVEHAYEYGFILRYPENKEEVTGFQYQPYHWRYVGKDVAKIIHEKNITLEEYYATYILK